MKYFYEKLLLLFLEKIVCFLKPFDSFFKTLLAYLCAFYHFFFIFQVSQNQKGGCSRWSSRFWAVFLNQIWHEDSNTHHTRQISMSRFPTTTTRKRKETPIFSIGTSSSKTDYGRVDGVAGRWISIGNHSCCWVRRGDWYPCCLIHQHLFKLCAT